MRAWAVGVALFVTSSVEAHKPTTTKFTYHRDVYPVVLDKCGSCHRPGGVGPMSLLSYKETYPWAVSIKNEVLGLRMPPWFADERYGEFKHRKTLSASEVNTIVDWCIGGTPEGDPIALSSLTVKAEWALGEPDLVLSMEKPITLGPNVSEVVEDILLPTGLEQERWVKAVDFRPQRPNVVRSALVFRERAARPEGLIASWIPGEDAEVLPKGRGVHLPKQGTLVLRVHYKKTWLDEGKEVSDRSRLGLYFQDDETGKAVETVVVATDGDDAIEASGNGFTTTVVKELPGRVDVLALLPWIDVRLTSLHAEALLPGGRILDLIRLREPHPDWPRKFWLEAPVSLPPKSRIRLTLTAPEEEPLKASHVLLLDVISD